MPTYWFVKPYGVGRQAAVELVYNAAQALLYTLIVYYMVGFDIDGSTGACRSRMHCARGLYIGRDGRGVGRHWGSLAVVLACPLTAP